MTSWEAMLLVSGGSVPGAAWLALCLAFGVMDCSLFLVCSVHWLCSALPHKIRYARIRRQRRRAGSVTPPPPPPSSN